MRQKFSTAKRILAASAAILLLAAAASPAGDVPLQDRAPDRYTVQKGDTLWGIAARFLRDPWRWPDIWRLNRDEIKNPHWIYPGDVIVLERGGNASGAAGGSAGGPRLVLERASVRLSPSVRISQLERQAIPSIPPGDIEPYLSRPLITGPEGLPGTAQVVGGRDSRVVRGAGDLVYAVDVDASGGDLWHIYRPGRTLTSLETGETLGIEQVFLGTAKVERRGPEAASLRILSSTQEIVAGDRLVPAPREQLLNYAPHPPQKDIRAQIIATDQNSLEVGRGSIVTLDKGAKDGLDFGTVLAISRVPALKDPRPGPQWEDPATQLMRNLGLWPPERNLQVPEERLGLLFVFRVFDRVSYGLVLNSTDSVTKGDLLRQP